ncbi:unnamed protein product [Musa acuminata subsp. malaccensis]|uniref:(wild Malaysian banana) hypothetical protein n=1 Tax=Musa acuminata subsp. malaccensis TaxID=214687 RepID=A0A804IEM8_MUSAM|nr:PREDICTED: uncharacterized protein LOC103979282 [Musa acuminata subsp. malaccensis]XP_009393638.1 PREDICTED: uncharacterized protein LOC103979282 [Musa acuminata subsp. malaccensis]CAG1850851.1 unnamed protein product [Musa acuminata subsp. malaccensis]
MSTATGASNDPMRTEGDGGAAGLLAAEADNVGEHGGFPWMRVLVLAILTFNFLLALYRSTDDPGNAAFVVASYADLISLFYCLRLFERTPEAAVQMRKNLKKAVWCLSALLVAMFSYRVAAVMPPAVAVIVWCMAGFTVSGSFCALFVFDSDGYGDTDGCEKKHLTA